MENKKFCVISLVSVPVHVIADGLHRAAQVRNIHIPKKHLRWPIGCTFMLCGSGLAVISGGWGLPHSIHIIIDMVAYGVHGAGAVPFVNVIIKRFEMEG